MPKQRTFTDEQLIEAVANSISIRQVLEKLNLRPAGGNYKTIKRLITDLEIPDDHLSGQAYLKGKTHNWTPKIPLAEIMVTGSTYKTYYLKLRLLREGRLENKCSICGIGNQWNGQELNMILDHINGVSDDHRFKNLRLVCPNCNSQLPTHCGRNLKK